MKRTILILEDDATLRTKILLPKLEALGFQILQAGKVREAEGLLAEHPVDLLVVDGLLPDGSGVDFIRSLRKKGNRCPIIFMSAFYKDMKSYEQLTGLGVSHVLRKPVDPNTLCQRIGQVLPEPDG